MGDEPPSEVVLVVVVQATEYFYRACFFKFVSDLPVTPKKLKPPPSYKVVIDYKLKV